MRAETEDAFRREAQSPNELDLSGIGRSVARRKLWIIAPTLLCLLGSTALVNTIKPRYTAEAKILIENQENFFTQPDKSDRPSEPVLDDEAVQSQVQLVQSRDIARDAIKALHLQGNPEFDRLADGVGPVTRILVMLGLEHDPLRVPPEDRILSTYFEKLEVYPVVKSRVLSVQFTAQDPDLAAKAANTISDLYINLQSDAKRDSARAAAGSLAALIADLKVRAAAAETKAQEFRAQNGLLVGTNNTTITSQQLSDINTQLAQARTSEADAQAKAKLLRDMIRANRISEVPDVANADVIRKISDQRMLLQAQYAQLSQTFLPGHPRMQELRAQLADYDSQLRVAADKIVHTLENDAHIAAGRVENLQAALDAQKQTATTAGADEVTLNNLELQAKLLKDQLEFNTQKYQEAVAREEAQSTPADARVISRAVAPALPSFPRKVPTIAIFTIAGMILSLGLVIGRELLSGRAFIRNNNPGSMPVPLVEEGVYGEEEQQLAGLHEPLPVGAPLATASPAEEQDPRFATALSGIEKHQKLHGGVRVLVTAGDFAGSIMPIAVRLARALARSHRVILVDCGVGAPGLNEVLMSGQPRHASLDETSPGLFDLLSGQTTFAEVIHRDPLSRLHVVPLGSTASQGDGEGFAIVAHALSETYDYVVLAKAAVAAGGDLPVAERADIAVVVAGEDQLDLVSTPLRETLEAAGVHDIVTVPGATPGDHEEARSAA